MRIHSRIQSHELAPVTRMHDLMELEIAGINMPPDILSSNEANHLLFVGLKRCGLNDGQVRQIADAPPKLAMEVHGNGVSASLIRSLEESGRVFSAANRLAFERYLKQLEGNTKSAEWFGTHEARFQYGTRPHTITQFALTTLSSSWSSNQSSKPSKARGRRWLAGLERKSRSIP